MFKSVVIRYTEDSVEKFNEVDFILNERIIIICIHQTFRFHASIS